MEISQLVETAGEYLRQYPGSLLLAAMAVWIGAMIYDALQMGRVR